MREEEQQLAWEWINDSDQAARDALIERNLPFVVYVAKRYVRRGLSIDELVAEGNVGLIHAATNYDPARGARFATYARRWIEKAVWRALSKAIAAKDSSLDEASLASREQSNNDAEMHELVVRVMQSIDQVTDNPRYRDILKYRLGLYGSETWSLKATGEAVGLSDERVRQVEQEYLGRVWEVVEPGGRGDRLAASRSIASYRAALAGAPISVAT